MVGQDERILSGVQCVVHRNQRAGQGFGAAGSGSGSTRNAESRRFRPAPVDQVLVVGDHGGSSATIDGCAIRAVPRNPEIPGFGSSGPVAAWARLNAVSACPPTSLTAPGKTGGRAASAERSFSQSKCGLRIFCPRPGQSRAFPEFFDSIVRRVA